MRGEVCENSDLGVYLTRQQRWWREKVHAFMAKDAGVKRPFCLEIQLKDRAGERCKKGRGTWKAHEVCPQKQKATFAGKTVGQNNIYKKIQTQAVAKSAVVCIHEGKMNGKGEGQWHGTARKEPGVLIQEGFQRDDACKGVRQIGRNMRRNKWKRRGKRGKKKTKHHVKQAERDASGSNMGRSSAADFKSCGDYQGGKNGENGRKEVWTWRDTVRLTGLLKKGCTIKLKSCENC